MLGVMGIGAGFINAAGRGGKEKFSGVKLFALTTDPEINSITGTDIVVKTIKGGVAHEDTYASLDGDMLSISADKNTEIIIIGEITECEIGSNTYFSRISVTNTALTSLDCSYCYALQELNLSANTALTSLDCSDCSALQELNLSTNTALTSLGCSYCSKIEIIYYPATNEDISTAVAGAITDADAADGTVYTDSEGAYYSTIADAATEKGWTIEQL